MALPDDFRCPECGSPNIEEDDPYPGEHTCRDCGGWIDEEDLPVPNPQPEALPAQD